MQNGGAATPPVETDQHHSTLLYITPISLLVSLSGPVT